MAQGLVDSSFQYHLLSAKNNGITKEEIAEILTHAAFYAGWPKAWAAFKMAKDVWTEEAPEGNEREAHERNMLFPVGEPNSGFAQYFTGQSYLAPLSTEQMGIFNVTFEPGCRNNWHIHHATSGGGQILICVGGRGYFVFLDYGESVFLFYIDYFALMGLCIFIAHDLPKLLRKVHGQNNIQKDKQEKGKGASG